jgi:signal transduction histidine kinase
MTVLERPIGTATLVRAVEVAVRSRRRQYQVRDLIRESEEQIAALKENARTIRMQEERLRKVEKLAAAGQLAASLAHEINNPLTSVTNTLFILQNFSSLSHDTTLLVATASEELARVSRIVKQSLSYYRVNQEPKEVDLALIVHESLRIFEEKFRKAELQVRSRIRPLSIFGFGDEIRQAIDNLLLNAIEATPKGGRLAVSLQRSHDRKDQKEPGVARLTIADSGMGIGREQFPRLFEPFFTTKAEKGNGLGLWVVRNIVTKHEGNIRIRSSTRPCSRGTVVSILWPAHPVAEMHPVATLQETK